MLFGFCIIVVIYVVDAIIYIVVDITMNDDRLLIVICHVNIIPIVGDVIVLYYDLLLIYYLSWLNWFVLSLLLLMFISTKLLLYFHIVIIVVVVVLSFG